MSNIYTDVFNSLASLGDIALKALTGLEIGAATEPETVEETPTVEVEKEAESNNTNRALFAVNYVDNTPRTGKEIQDKIMDILDEKIFLIRTMYANTVIYKLKFMLCNFEGKFEWNPDTDQFDGEINGNKVSYDEKERAFLYWENEPDESQETAEKTEEEPIELLPIENEAGQVESYEDPLPDEPAASAVYDENGNPILEEEIPSLSDYYRADVVKAENSNEVPATEPDEEECDCKEDDTIAFDLYKKLNIKEQNKIEKFLPAVIQGTEDMIAAEDYKYVIDANGKINIIIIDLAVVRAYIKDFPMPQIWEVVPEDCLKNVYMSHFGFKSVKFVTTKKPNEKRLAYCTLI